MDPITWAAIIGAGASVATTALKPGGGMPAGPAISGANPSNIMGGAFNVGGGIGGAGQLGALGAWAPYIIIGLVAWLILKK